MRQRGRDISAKTRLEWRTIIGTHEVMVWGSLSENGHSDQCHLALGEEEQRWHRGIELQRTWDQDVRVHSRL